MEKDESPFSLSFSAKKVHHEISEWWGMTMRRDERKNTEKRVTRTGMTRIVRESRQKVISKNSSSRMMITFCLVCSLINVNQSVFCSSLNLSWISLHFLLPLFPFLINGKCLSCKCLTSSSNSHMPFTSLFCSPQDTLHRLIRLGWNILCLLPIFYSILT